MKQTSLQADLSAAIASRAVVRITRKVEPGAADGYVVGVSSQWLLLLLVGEGICYAGFQALRLQDVASLEVPSPRAAFYATVLRLRGLRRPRVPNINLSSTQNLVRSTSERFPIISIHREKADPDVCHIGRLISASSASVSLLEISPDAAWDEHPVTYRLGQITRVDFGGPYEDALALALVSGAAIARTRR